MRVVVVGGSTPFTAGFVEARRTAGSSPGHLVLHGRNPDALCVLGRYAQRRLDGLGWEVSTTRDIAEALADATVVIHQPRYGGLSGRAADERLAAALDVPADETLGPAGLQAALRASPDVRAFSASVREHCPEAVVLNLTNPLSVTTALIAGDGLTVLGLCELPVVTVRWASELLGRAMADLDWAYVGLNHRGFIYGMRADGEDLLPGPAVRCNFGALGAELAAAGALPLKYFGLLCGNAPHGAGRAAVLGKIRAQMLAELARDPAKRPPSLMLRDMPWYAESAYRLSTR